MALVGVLGLGFNFQGIWVQGLAITKVSGVGI